MKLFKIKIPEDDTPMKTMQKAYLVYSTISTIKSSDGKPAIRSRWQEQVGAEHKIHNELLTKIGNGERIEGIEHDPLDITESDYTVDYNMVPGFLQREKSIRGDVTLKI